MILRSAARKGYRSLMTTESDFNQDETSVCSIPRENISLTLNVFETFLLQLK